MGIHPEGGVRHLHWTLLLLLVMLGCSEPYSILEEDDSAPVAFRQLELVPRRQSGELGLMLRMRLEGYGPASPSAVVRCRVLDGNGNPQQNQQFFSTIAQPTTEEPDSFVMVQPELAELAFPGTGNSPKAEIFLPFQWWEENPGESKLKLELDLLEEKLDTNFRENLPKCLLGLAGKKPVGHIQVEFDYQYPELTAVQVWVRNAVLDTSQFDPHSSDAYLLAIGSTYGFPDLYWTLGLEEQIVHRSARWRNSIAGVWKTPSDPIYIDGTDSPIQLCLIDWDDDRFFNNRSDAISCWAGQLSEISRDTLVPTFLDMPLVGQMEVVALWNE